MSSCNDNSYNVRHTDTRKNSYTVPRNRTVEDALDITLIGKSRLEYGQVFNRNTLKLLERFACPSDDTDLAPDLTIANTDSFRYPTEGQLWFDNKNDVLFRYNGTSWVAFSSITDIAGVSGVLMAGSVLPRPVSQYSGYQFRYDECCWIVSPYNYSGEIDYMACYTETLGGTVFIVNNVRYVGEEFQLGVPANYLIIGIRGITGGITGQLPQDVVQELEDGNPTPPGSPPEPSPEETPEPPGPPVSEFEPDPEPTPTPSEDIEVTPDPSIEELVPEPTPSATPL